MQVKEQEIKYEIKDLSKGLFWDVNIDKINWEDSKKIIISRVIEYGMLKDWKIINHVYKRKKIKKLAVTLRYLDPVSLSFLSTLFSIPKKKFRCYTLQQSNQKH